MAGAKSKRRSIDGILIFDKPLGMSSNAALQKVRWLFNANKGGHTGSLDPLATGVLPLCLGEATKFSQYLLDADKAYVTEARLGMTTATGDAEGDVLEIKPFNVTLADVEALLPRFTGEIDQVPPMYSALKHEGQPLYKLARAGETIERKARTITISQLKVLGLEGDRLQLEVHCSKGTYIRSLVEDIGAGLGCGAHVSALRRIKAGPFDLSQSVTLEALEALHAEGGAEASIYMHKGAHACAAVGSRSARGVWQVSSGGSDAMTARSNGSRRNGSRRDGSRRDRHETDNSGARPP